jgi:hypothetical protein
LPGVVARKEVKVTTLAAKPQLVESV